MKGWVSKFSADRGRIHALEATTIYPQSLFPLDPNHNSQLAVPETHVASTRGLLNGQGNL